MSQFIEIYDNALTPSICQQIIAAHQASKETTAGRAGCGVDKSLKDSQDISLFHPDWQAFFNQVLSVCQSHMKQYLLKYPTALVSGITPTIKNPVNQQPLTITVDNFPQYGADYIDDITGFAFRYSGFTVQKYQQNSGGYHYFHSEIYPQGEQNEPLHRQLALLIYLNDVEQGGETEFFYQDIKAKPKAGSLVIFPAGFTHTHKGHIPLSDDKYVITAWLMFNRAEQLYPSAQEQ